MKPLRSVSLNIGKGVYTVSTPLDDAALDRVRGVIAEACGEVQAGARQEDVLALALMRVAYELVDVEERLASADNISTVEIGRNVEA